MHGWAVGTDGILATIDGGRTWRAQESPTTNELDGIAFSDPRHGWVGGDLGVILATTDGGQSWVAQMTRSGEALAAIALQ